jgi:hypothetical protein
MLLVECRSTHCSGKENDVMQREYQRDLQLGRLLDSRQQVSTSFGRRLKQSTGTFIAVLCPKVLMLPSPGPTRANDKYPTPAGL